MKTKIVPAVDGRRRLWWMGCALLALVAVLVVFWPRRPPQLGVDSDVFHTVDALFTAVTARDEKALAQCERRLRVYRQEGQLPAAAADALDRIVVAARSGRWEAAAQALYDFMRGQRREGAEEQRPSKNGKKHSQK